MVVVSTFKHHIGASMCRRGVKGVVKSICSLAPPFSKLPCSNGSSNTKSLEGKHYKKPSSSSSRLLQVNEDVGTLHLHSRPASFVLPSIKHVSDGIGSSNCCRALLSGRRSKPPCVGTRGCKDKSAFHSLHKDESPSANPLMGPEEKMGNVGAHLWQHMPKLYLHQCNVEATLNSQDHVKEDMGAAPISLKNGKNKHALHQREEFLLNMGDEDWGTLLCQHDIAPTSFSRIVKAVPPCKRTQVNFRNIISLIVLLQTMDIDIDSINIRKAPFMYQRNPVADLQPKIEYLEKLGLHRKEMQRLVLKYPYALCPPIQEIQARFQFLRSIPLQHEDVLRILRKAPTVFLLSVDKHIQPKIELFKNVGISHRYIRRMLVSHPRIFSSTLSNLENFSSFLQGLGLRPGTVSFSRAMQQTGPIKVETLQVRVKALINAGFSLDDIQGMVKLAPLILTSSAQGITNRLEYLVNVMNRSIGEIVKFPLYFRFSFDKRIQARHEYLVQCAAEKQLNKHFRLSYIFGPPDKVFYIRFPGIVVQKK